MKKGSMWIDTKKQTKELGDLFGLFFEDINRAADGGLYAELVQNRSFEFDPVDAPHHNALTAWEPIGKPFYGVEEGNPLHNQNPRYLHLIAKQAGEGIANRGYGAGIFFEKGKRYRFSIWARTLSNALLKIKLVNNEGRIYTESNLFIHGNEWMPYAAALCPEDSCRTGRLQIVLDKAGEIFLDMVSLFPEDTFCNRVNGMRKDIALALAEMKPRFMRFPGGCLVHDGVLDSDSRSSMYRWKNTLGPIWQRPPRRSAWRGNQTLGLGFYEYFLFCEDIGAKPIPVLPGGCDPHRKMFVPIDQLQPWIDDALDLIEFANGSPHSHWGSVRANMGHPMPFGLEYIAIGNEEVHQAFFDRFALFVEAIRANYPEIKIIGNTGPYCAGSEFDRGWQSGLETNVDLMDEHYYAAPPWFIANACRYDSYDPHGPKVFVGEFASRDNLYENALCEAAYMTHLQNTPTVTLACYAPMLCHRDYVSWKPDMLWYDNHQILKTPNYYVQALFMQHQGDALLQTDTHGLDDILSLPQTPLSGDICIASRGMRVALSQITLTEYGITHEISPHSLESDQEMVLHHTYADSYALEMQVRCLEDGDAFSVRFGGSGGGSQMIWHIGGALHQAAMLTEHYSPKKKACLSQCQKNLGKDVVLHLCIQVKARKIHVFIDGQPVHEAVAKLPEPQILYHTQSIERKTGDVIIKAVNVLDEPVQSDICLKHCVQSKVDACIHELAGYALDESNTFDTPTSVVPKEKHVTVQLPQFSYSFPPRSVSVMRIHTGIDMCE